MNTYTRKCKENSEQRKQELYKENSGCTLSRITVSNYQTIEIRGRDSDHPLPRQPVSKRYKMRLAHQSFPRHVLRWKWVFPEQFQDENLRSVWNFENDGFRFSQCSKRKLLWECRRRTEGMNFTKKKWPFWTLKISKPSRRYLPGLLSGQLVIICSRQCSEAVRQWTYMLLTV